MLEEKVRSLWPGRGDAAGGEPPAEEPPGSPSAGPSSKLFSCSQCDVVYIALEKDVCSSCRGELREVPKTFSHG